MNITLNLTAPQAAALAALFNGKDSIDRSAAQILIPAFAVSARSVKAIRG